MLNVNSENIERLYRQKYLGNLPEVAVDDPQYQYLLWALNMLESAHNAVLDAGCGGGKYAQSLANSHVGKIYAVDLFDKVPLLSGVEYTKASIDNLPYSDETFDLIYAFSVLFYLDDPEKGIVEFFRVLKPGGILLISAHTKYSLFTAIRVMKRFMGMKSMSHLEGVKFYPASYYAKMFENNGFEIMKIDGYRLSFLLGPVYRKFSRMLMRLTGSKLPVVSRGVTGSRILAWYKSVFGYHSVILARKV